MQITPTPEEKLINIVNVYFNVDVLKKSRKREVVEARAVCYKILHGEGRTKTFIAQLFKKHHATVIWSLSNFDNIVSQDRILNTKYHICALEFRNNENSIFLFNEQELRAEIVDLKKSLSFLKRENKYLHSLRIEQKPYESIISLLKSRVPPTQTGSFRLKIKALVNGL